MWDASLPAVDRPLTLVAMQQLVAVGMPARLEVRALLEVLEKAHEARALRGPLAAAAAMSALHTWLRPLDAFASPSQHGGGKPHLGAVREAPLEGLRAAVSTSP